MEKEKERNEQIRPTGEQKQPGQQGGPDRGTEQRRDQGTGDWQRDQAGQQRGTEQPQKK